MFCSIHSFSPPSGLNKLAVASKARAMDASLADIAKAWSLHEAGADYDADDIWVEIIKQR